MLEKESAGSTVPAIATAVTLVRCSFATALEKVEHWSILVQLMQLPGDRCDSCMVSSLSVEMPMNFLVVANAGTLVLP